MVLIHCNFVSKILGIWTSMNVLLPQPENTQKVFTGKYPTLYLLHGLADDYSTWLRRTSVERYAESLNLAIVMPDADKSFYTDMANGNKYFTFISEELPVIARSFFPLSSLRKDNFVAGLSMGGYGALKVAFRCPDKFIAAASLSGVTDIESTSAKSVMGETRYKNIFGETRKIKGSDNDLFYLAEKMAKLKGPKPMLYQCCGKEDKFYQDNVRFMKFGKKLSLNLTYEDGPGGHSWEYWDKNIQKVLAWLPIKSCHK
ncbi:MAG: alpha/beta hydrolase family protein [Elusimicrobia bacterium]|nr:alpha/beta hydrolase family protein [Elusimicrobiota bacterium]